MKENVNTIEWNWKHYVGKNHTAIVLCDDATAEHGNRDGGTQDLSIHCTDHESLQSPPLKSLPTVTIYSTVCLCERDARCEQLEWGIKNELVCVLLTRQTKPVICWEMFWIQSFVHRRRENKWNFVSRVECTLYFCCWLLYNRSDVIVDRV